MVFWSGLKPEPFELVMPPDQALRSLPCSTYISAAGLSRGS
jgi:hypothetical protein